MILLYIFSSLSLCLSSSLTSCLCVMLCVMLCRHSCCSFSHKKKKRSLEHLLSMMCAVRSL